MKVKRLKVGVRSLDEGLQEFGSTLKAIRSGQSVTKRTGVYFATPPSLYCCTGQS